MKFTLFLIIINLLSCSHEKSGLTLKIHAAASLATVTPELANAFRKDHPGLEFEYNFAASSTIARQIEYGAACDIYISAHPQWINYLGERNLIRPETITIAFRNKMVVVIPQNSKITLTTLLEISSNEIKKIAMADPTNVPAGMYARDILQKADLWTVLKERCVFAVDVRAALAYVETGSVDLGFVYSTDAMSSDRVISCDIVPESLQPEIIYQASVPISSNSEKGQSFLRFLKTDEAQSIVRDHGFQPLTVVTE